eukprot:353615-Chlamydomonas_euryale.AAC.1
MAYSSRGNLLRSVSEHGERAPGAAAGGGESGGKACMLSWHGTAVKQASYVMRAHPQLHDVLALAGAIVKSAYDKPLYRSACSGTAACQYVVEQQSMYLRRCFSLPR